MDENLNKLQKLVEKNKIAKSAGVRTGAPRQLVSSKEKILVSNILEGKSIYESALAAGYTDSMARTKVYKYFSDDREDSLKPDLWDYWQKKLQTKLRLFDVSIDSVLSELKLLAFSDISNYVTLFDENDIETSDDPEKVFMRLQGRTLRVKSFRDIPKQLTPAIESISEDKHGIKIKLYNKLDSLDKLAKYLKMYSDVSANSSNDDTPKEINLVVNGTRSPLFSSGGKFEDAKIVGDSDLEK